MKDEKTQIDICELRQRVMELSEVTHHHSHTINTLLTINRTWALMVKVAVIVAVAVTVGVMILNTIGETL